MDIREQIAETEYCHSDRFEFEWERVKYSQPLLAQAFYFQADQILAIKVEEDGDCYHGSSAGADKYYCEKCNGTGTIPGIIASRFSFLNESAPYNISPAICCWSFNSGIIGAG